MKKVFSSLFNFWKNRKQVNRFDDSLIGEIVPRFKLEIKCKEEEARSHLEKKIKEDRTVSGLRSMDLIFLKIPQSDQHYWSPEMTVRIEHDEFDEYPEVSCLVGPKQSVWVMFIFFYGAIALVTLFGGIFGMIEYSSEGYSNWLWVFPIGLILFLSVFFTTKIGQQKGRDQMLHLVSFLYHSLSEVTEVKRVE